MCPCVPIAANVCVVYQQCLTACDVVGVGYSLVMHFDKKTLNKKQRQKEVSAYGNPNIPRWAPVVLTAQALQHS